MRIPASYQLRVACERAHTKGYLGKSSLADKMLLGVGRADPTRAAMSLQAKYRLRLLIKSSYRLVTCCAISISVLANWRNFFLFYIPPAIFKRLYRGSQRTRLVSVAKCQQERSRNDVAPLLALASQAAGWHLGVSLNVTAFAESVQSPPPPLLSRSLSQDFSIERRPALSHIDEKTLEVPVAPQV